MYSAKYRVPDIVNGMASDKSHSEKIIFDGIINMGSFLRQQKRNPSFIFPMREFPHRDFFVVGWITRHSRIGSRVRGPRNLLVWLTRHSKSDPALRFSGEFMNKKLEKINQRF